MKIANGAQNQVVNNIFSGFYYQRITGLRGKYYEFSSSSYPIRNFAFPPDAILLNPDPTGNVVLGAGRRLRAGCPPSSNRTGTLYFYNQTDIIGGCHGYGHNDLTYYSGYNFYNAFYPAGYFSPPFGETFSVFKSNQDEFDNLQNGTCNSLNVTEYNELFGIVSKTASNSSILSSTSAPNTYSPIYTPREACPPEVASESYYDEFQFSQIGGTSTAIGGNNQYNGNPIPTALDSFDIKVNGRYQINTVGKTNYIAYTGGRPIPSYTSGSQTNKLNNNLCYAALMETRVSVNRGTNGIQLIEAPDAIRGVVGDQVSFVGAENFHYWHFTFRENAEYLPFYNNFVQISANTPLRQRKLNEGTALFLPVISSDDYYWQNRQCPDTVDFLSWTFGASIYACPSEHFDVPYYAALKKFGFYGTRFMNSCKALNLAYPLSGVEQAIELETSSSDVEISDGELEPGDLDKDGSWSFPAYNNLLKVAKAEERYANMYALNKGFFIWANSGYIASDPFFTSLSSSNSRFQPVYNSLVLKFANVFTSGLSSFTDGEPNVLMIVAQNGFNIIESGTASDILSNNDEFISFKKTLSEILSGEQFNLWNEIEKKYSYYVSNGTTINDDFYQVITSGREKRLRTRYFENLVRGNAVDLYPLNSIPFSFDSARDYIESTGWARRPSSFGESSSLPEINRRYFEGAYGKSSAITGLVDTLNALAASQTDYYYPGYFNDVRLDKTVPTPTYQYSVSGKILDERKRKFSPSGWLGLGYNEVGALDANFSCFTPIIIQQTLPRVFTKIGQSPTLRTQAVDYHTIPEDKISRKYPEIIYWCSKLKLLDCGGRNLYPLKYKWYRVPKGSYDSALANGTLFNDPASQTGQWGCVEGDGPECSIFHPLDSFPLYTGTHSNRGSYTFLKGAVKNLDDQYYYYCSISGRFGIRITNNTELNIEDWLRFDMSVKNGLNNVGSVSLKFELTDYLGTPREVTITSDKDLPNYAGYQQDINTTVESVIEEKIPPPNAGFGDVKAFRFIGPIGYIGTTRTYTPSRLTDTRGLRETWGHLLEYGALVSFTKELSQNEGDWLYGYKHLPTCENYEMANGEKGIKVTPYFNGNKIAHWSLEQRAVASLDMKAGIQWDRIFNQGELYPPINARFEAPNMGVGHWTWGNNLGAIKRFGKYSTKADIKFIGGYGANDEATVSSNIEKVKTRLISSTDLAGTNCGFTPYGLGRNMIYYLEAFERFYIICDPLKKKNVSNKTFMCPGVRMNNSAIQYFWLGHPTNTYVKRRQMYGPYAYQWRVERHNRDRNGNGISEGFYSMGYATRYSLLYDAPAIYGLYVKKQTSSNYLTLINELKKAREVVSDVYGFKVDTMRNLWFGERGTDDTSRRYGDITYSCDADGPSFNEDLCRYVSLAQGFASSINFSDHSCPQDLLAKGECFDPCLSMRYAQGFFPGGKLLDLFGFGGASTTNDKDTKNVRLVPLVNAKPNGSFEALDEQSPTDRNLVFRSPLNTPHARIARGIKSVGATVRPRTHIGGISPCQDGGSDHCNYITPTLHLGVSSYIRGNGSVFTQRANYNAEIFGASYNIRGEVT